MPLYKWALRVPELPTRTAVPREQILASFASVATWYNLLLWPACLAVVVIVVRHSLKAIRMAPCKSVTEEIAQRKLLLGLADCGIWLDPGDRGVSNWSVDARRRESHHSVHSFHSQFCHERVAGDDILVSWSDLVCHVCLLAAALGVSEWIRFRSRVSGIGPFFRRSEACEFGGGDRPAAQLHASDCDDRFRRLVMLLILLGVVGPLFANRIALRVSERLRIYAVE
jgi:hypothetical protein